MKFNYKYITTLFVFIASCTVATAQTTEEDWQRKAVDDYPELGVQGSELNKKYIQKVQSLRNSDPLFFKNPRWPYILAEEVNVKPIIPGLENVNQDNQPIKKTAHIQGKQVEVLDAANLPTEVKAGEMICVEGVILRTSQRTLSDANSFFVKLSPNVFCEFLVKPFLSRNSTVIPDFGSRYVSSQGKIVIEDDAVSIYAPMVSEKKRSKLGAILKPEDKVVIYGQYTGLNTLGVEQGYLIKDCILTTSAAPRRRR